MAKKKNYAWAICAACTLMYLCNIGISSNLMAVYLPFIQKRGITGTQGSSIITVRCIFSVISTLLLSYYYKTFSIRKGATVATLSGVVAAVIYSLAYDNIWLYYLGAAFAGISGGLGAITPAAILINKWFKKSKGAAIGIASAGSGIASMAFTPIITKVVQATNLQTAYRGQAVFALICAALIYIIVRDDPIDIGAEALGEDEALDQTKLKIKPAITKPASEELEKKLKYLTLIMFIFLGGAGQTGTTHVTIVTTSSGYNPNAAALITTIYAVFLLLGKFSCGAVADKIGLKKASILFILLGVCGCLATNLFDGISIAKGLVFSVFVGLGFAVFNVGMPLWTQDFSTEKNYAKALKNNQLFNNFGGIIFSSLPGRIADKTGEYQTAYMMIGTIMLIALGMLLFQYGLKKKIDV